MTDNNLVNGEIPSALPDFEDEDSREKLLRHAAEESDSTDSGLEEDEAENADLERAPRKKSKRHVLRTIAGFALFLFILIGAVSWFFGIGWFSAQEPHPVSRSGSKGTQTPPMTEDEKLKAALSMVAAKQPLSSEADIPSVVEANNPVSDIPTAGATLPNEPDETILNRSQQTGRVATQVSDESAVTDPAVNISRVTSELQRNDTKVLPSTIRSAENNAIEPPGRSLFFGVTAQIAPENATQQVPARPTSSEAGSQKNPSPGIPFGTLLPVRLIGSIYTFRGSGGFVRMELARTVEGSGYTFPAGMMIVGTMRGGESAHAFVTVVGLIDPVSGDLIKFTGELLGRDGGSGIEGHKRKLSSGWSRILRGLKDTAGTIIGSVGALRSGGTVVISDSIRRGGSSVAEEFSGALSKNKDDDGFVEVAAGSNGYVLVTGLPENSGSTIAESQNRNPSGLSDGELADLLTGTSTVNMRSHISKMTPEFRRLVEEAMSATTGRRSPEGTKE